MFRSPAAWLISAPFLSLWILVGTTYLLGVDAFVCGRANIRSKNVVSLQMAPQISQTEAQRAIDTVVSTLRKDSAANKDLGRLDKVTVILNYGSPSNGIVAVRFNASFKKGGFGLSAVPLPFGLGQTNESEGRGTMVAQVKASVDTKTKKVKNCSVFRDLGYGRSFELKC